MAAEGTAADYLKLLAKRAELISSFNRIAAGFDAVVFPTVQNLAPKLADFASDDDYLRLNGSSLRNTYVVNMLNGCAVCLPINQNGTAPTSIMLVAPNGFDQHLF